MAPLCFQPCFWRSLIVTICHTNSFAFNAIGSGAKAMGTQDFFRFRIDLIGGILGLGFHRLGGHGARTLW
jgi:hypothetical protein